MRKLFAFFMLALFVSISFEGFAQSGPWSWQNPTPQGNTLRWVKYWDANNWYAVGLAGTFMKTSNAGTSWTISNSAGASLATSGQKTAMYYGHFFNANTGMVFGAGTTGGNGIWRTTNAGTTWDSTNVVPFTTGIFYFASFVNSNLGYASCTSAPYAYRTTNAGLTWEGLATTATASYDIHAFDSLNIIVSTTLGNVKKSTDGGATWTTISTGASTTLYRMVFANANTGYVYGGTTPATGFRYTTNAGLNWTTPTNTGLGVPFSTTFWDIDHKTIVVSNAKLEQDFELTTFPPDGWSVAGTSGIWSRSAAASGYGIGTGSTRAYFYSVQTGSEELISKTLTSPSVAGDSIKFDHAYATYAGENDNLDIFTSTNGGTNWTLLINLAGGAAGPLNTGGTVTTNFVPTAGQWATKRFSLPVGTNKISFKGNTAYGNNLYIDNVIVVPAAPPTVSSNIYLTGNAYALFKSTNMGTSWDSLTFLAPGAQQPWTSTYYSTDMVPGNNDDLITVGAFGLINKKQGSTNTVLTSVIKPGTINDVWAASSTGTVIAVGNPTSTGGSFDQILRSTNGGSTWAVVPYSTTSRTVFYDIEMVDNNTGWVVGSLSAVYKTTNGGANWDSVTTITDMAAGLTLRKVVFPTASTGYIFSASIVAPDSSTVFKTTNAGVSWIKSVIAGVTGSARQIYGASFINANTGWITNFTPYPLRTTDGGATWTPQTLVDGYTAGFLYNIKMFNASTGFCAVSAGGRVYKTTNGGDLWDTLSVPTRTYGFNALDFLNPNVGYVGGGTGVTMSTTNGGATWTQANTFGSTINNIFITPDTKAFAVGSIGYIFKNNNILTGIAGNENSMLPIKYTLEQNYPNPFNPTTTIKFALPKAGFVTLKIYDVAGREVMRLINNQNMNAGYQTQLFNGSMLSSGVYFYSLLVDNNLIATKKMVLVK